MTHYYYYYYDSKANKFYGPLDRMPPVMPYKDFELTNWIQYLSTLQPIPHTFTGHSRVVPEGEIEWRYEVDDKSDPFGQRWVEVTKHTYDNFHDTLPKRKVAVPIEAKEVSPTTMRRKFERLIGERERPDGSKVSMPLNESPGYTSTSGEEAKPEFDGNWDGNAVDDLIKENEKLRELLTAQPDKQAIDRLIDKMDEGDVKITFGLQERHIKRINEQAKKWGENKHLAVYSTHFWDNLAKEFAWEPFTLALYYFNHTNNPPSPQTGEKDMVGTMFLQQAAEDNAKKHYHNLSPYQAMVFGYIAGYKRRDAEPVKHQPPAAQSDQEAAERLRPKGVNRGVRWKEGFVAGCNHVRGQQQEDAVAFGIWLSKNYIAAVEDGYIGLKDKHHHTTADLYAIFTARHPTPKPGSHDAEGKEGAGC